MRARNFWLCLFFYRDSVIDMAVHYQFFNAKTHHRDTVFATMPAVRVKQVHGDTVICVESPLKEWVEADALVTRMTNLPIGVITADCAPVLMMAGGVVAAAHAGWQGALKGVLNNTVAAMDVGPSAIEARIGPCISQQSYEVSLGFERPFLERDAEAERFFMEGATGKLQFDLAGYCAFRLSQCGVKKVVIDGTDTLTHPDYYSHRGGAGEKERNLAAIMISG